MTTTEPEGTQPKRPRRNPTRFYIILAVLLALVIVLVGAVLVTKGIPALRNPTPEGEVVGDVTPTTGPTFEPGPTQPPTAVPPTAIPTAAPIPSPVMADVETPLFELESAGGRPSTEWTGFFGQVVDAQGQPLADVPLIVWVADGRGLAASPVFETGPDGSYEIRLAVGASAGAWSIQVLTADMQPASKLQTFQTDQDTQAGIQQIQVLWRQVP